MSSFQLLFDLYVPHILLKIFEEVSQPSLEDCRLVCRQWNNFIKSTMIPADDDLRRRRDCHVWKEAGWAAKEVSLPLAKNWRWLHSLDLMHAYLAKGGGVIDRFCVGKSGLTLTGAILLPSGPGWDDVRSGLDLTICRYLAHLASPYPPISNPNQGFCPNGPLGILRHETSLEFTDRYIFAVTDGFEIPVFDRETLVQVGVIDMTLTDESSKGNINGGGCLDLPPRSTHICTLKVVDGQDVYVVALQARCARLTLYKVTSDLSLSVVCELPFQEWDVAYKNHEPILQRMPPLIFAVSSTHVLYMGRLVRTSPVLFNHRDGAEVPKPHQCLNYKSYNEGNGEGAVVFDVRAHIGDAFYALAVDGHLELFSSADHERLFEDAFVATKAPAFGRNRIAYLSVRDGGCDLSCTVVQYSKGAFYRWLYVDGVSSGTTAHLTGAFEQFLLLQNGLDQLKVWNLRKRCPKQGGWRLRKKGDWIDKTVNRPFTSCVPIGTRTILVEAWSNDWADKKLCMWLRADIGR